MINFNRAIDWAASFDKADAAQLVMAIYACVDAQGDSIVAQSLDDVWNLSVLGATALHELAPNQGEGWDGCIWLDLLADDSSDSLAHKLAVLSPADTISPANVNKVVKAWLDDNFGDVPRNATLFNVEHERLYFDADSICQWDNELGWDFVFYHELANPTTEQVLAVLANKGWQPTFANDAE